MRCTKYTFGGSGADVETLVAGLAEDVPADTDARFEVETMGVAIRARFGVERDHNAHTVRMILRDILRSQRKYHPDRRRRGPQTKRAKAR